MAPVTSSSTNSIPLRPGIDLITKRTNSLSRCSFTGKLNKQQLPAQKYILPLSTSVRLFPQFRFGCNLQPKLQNHVVFATGTEVAVEEANLSAAENEASVDTIENVEAPRESPAQSKSPRARKSEMPPVKNEELIPGASFTGKVKSIQPFGAFVDFGAFTDGLVHVSRLSDSFVKDIASIVSVGQEVKVRLLEANLETGRISLTMRESDDPTKQKDASESDDKPRPPRKTGQRSNQKKEEVKKSKFVKGQDIEGTVKNLTRAGAFISLPEGEEGFLPTTEEADEGFVSMMGGSSLEIGQEVSVRVLRITRGKVTLTMKKEEDAQELDLKLGPGVVHTATNPFVLAFRSNKEISAFLDETKGEDKKEPLDDPGSNNVEIESPKEVEASSEVVSDDISLSTEDQITEEPTPTVAEESIEEVKISGEVANDDALPSEIVEEALKSAATDAIVNDQEQGDSELSEEPTLKNEVEPELSGEINNETSSGEEVIEKTADDAIDPSANPADNTLAASQGEEETPALERDSIETSTPQIDSADTETTSTGL